jgi:hypothetical protein
LFFFVCFRADDIKLIDDEGAVPSRSTRLVDERLVPAVPPDEVAALAEDPAGGFARLEREAASVPFKLTKDFREFVFVIEVGRSALGSSRWGGRDDVRPSLLGFGT